MVSEILRKVQPVEESASPLATPAVTDVPAAPVPLIERYPATDEPPPDELPTLADLEEQERKSQEEQKQQEQEQQESSGGRSLIVRAFTALWSGLTEWFSRLIAAVTKSRRTDQQPLTTETDETESGDFSSSEAEARVAELDPKSPDPETSGMPETVEAVGVPSWSMIDPTSEEDAPPPTQEPANEGTGVPSSSMKDAPSEDVAEPAPSAFAEEPDYQQSVVESLGVPKWSIKDDPEETPPTRPRKEPTHQESEPPILLGIEDEEAQTPGSVDEPGLVDSSPILEDDLVELEPEENPEHSMLDAIPLEEITREEESPELLILIDEDAFADVPELGQDVAALPHEEPSTRHIELEIDEADQVAPDRGVPEVVESDAPRELRSYTTRRRRRRRSHRLADPAARQGRTTWGRRRGRGTPSA